MTYFSIIPKDILRKLINYVTHWETLDELRYLKDFKDYINDNIIQILSNDKDLVGSYLFGTPNKRHLFKNLEFINKSLRLKFEDVDNLKTLANLRNINLLVDCRKSNYVFDDPSYKALNNFLDSVRNIVCLRVNILYTREKIQKIFGFDLNKNILMIYSDDRIRNSKFIYSLDSIKTVYSHEVRSFVKYLLPDYKPEILIGQPSLIMKHLQRSYGECYINVTKLVFLDEFYDLPTLFYFMRDCPDLKELYWKSKSPLKIIKYLSPIDMIQFDFQLPNITVFHAPILCDSISNFDDLLYFFPNVKTLYLAFYKNQNILELQEYADLKNVKIKFIYEKLGSDPKYTMEDFKYKDKFNLENGLTDDYF